MSVEPDDQLNELLQFLYACPVGLIELAADGEIRLINPLAMQLLLPIAQNGIVVNLFRVLETYAPELRNIVAAFSGMWGIVCEGKRIFVHPGGKYGSADPLVLACTLVRIDCQRFMAALTDVSKQVMQEQRLRQAETWFATLLDSVNDYAVISLDRNGFIDGVSAAAARQTGLSRDAMMNLSLDALDLQPRSTASSAARQIAIAQRDGWHLDEGWRTRPDGERYWCQRLVAARSEDECSNPRVITGYTVILRDVTQRASDIQRLKEMLTTDHLTGASNRAHFFEAAEHARLACNAQGQPLAVVAVDIDRFKRINDTYGHAAGDAALRAVSAACRALLRPDDLFARLGGEEFVVLLPSMDLDSAVGLAERLRVAVKAITVQVGDVYFGLTASFGCAAMTDHVTAITELLTAADALLYTAKRNGRNRVEPSLPSVAVLHHAAE